MYDSFNNVDHIPHDGEFNDIQLKHDIHTTEYHSDMLKNVASNFNFLTEGDNKKVPRSLGSEYDAYNIHDVQLSADNVH